MTWIVADPWLFEFDFDNAWEREKSLGILLAFVDERPHDVKLLPILDADWFERRRNADLRTRHSGRTTARIARLVRHEINEAPRQISCVPSAPQDVPRAWYEAVDTVLTGDTPPHWRDPIVMIPSARREPWPKDNEIEFRIDGTVVLKRILAVIEEIVNHPHLLKDLDPWRCEDELERRHTDQCHRVLPRPPCVRDAPMNEWRMRLDEVPDHGRDGDRLYFIPPRDWEPTEISKEEWREHPFGPHKQKPVGAKRKKGPADETGRTWAWDDEERHHWDVQDADEKSTGYTNVNPDGRVRP